MRRAQTKSGKAPPRGKWPLFHSLRKGKYFEIHDLTAHTALRAKATRMSRQLKRRFSVRKEANGSGKEVIRVYRTS